MLARVRDVERDRRLVLVVRESRPGGPSPCRSSACRLVALAARGSAGNVAVQVPPERSPCDNRSHLMAPDVMGSPMNDRWSGLSKMN